MMSLSNLARMAEARAGFVAGPLAAYQRAHTLDDQGLAEVLHCPTETLVHLRLCRLPRPDHYDQDRERIAAHVHADPVALAQVLNREMVEP
ncbi:MAG TPA: hypothetical protein VEL31_31320 [Ktedonobacteraceae bacterium]|nr:hypothetical protein [Ktedonobacteraceae bacterium]